MGVDGGHAAGHPWQGSQCGHGGQHKCRHSPGEGGEAQPQCQHRAQIVDEAGPQDTLAELGAVEGGLKHQRVHHRHDGGGGQGDAGQPGGAGIPPQSPVDDRRAPQKRGEKSKCTNDRELPHLAAHYLRLQLGAGQEGQQHRPSGGEKTQPLVVGADQLAAVERSRHRPGRHSDADLDQCNGDLQVIGDDGGQDRQRQSQGCYQEQVFHTPRRAPPRPTRAPVPGRGGTVRQASHRGGGASGRSHQPWWRFAGNSIPVLKRKFIAHPLHPGSSPRRGGAPSWSDQSCGEGTTPGRNRQPGRRRDRRDAQPPTAPRQTDSPALDWLRVSLL